ncbi:hypothetical protein VTP01DRAFT_8722 [Rhizomucor pusillus]|uniref:uncharacterized protein n=1 Tax=Rhizomucor pusillus TaxID=4840 RepID=UPI003743E125
MYSQFIHYESPNEPLVRVVSEEEVEELQEIDEAGPVTTLMTIDDMEPETKQSPPLTQPSPAPEPSKFITLLQEEGLSVTEAAQNTRIPRSTAYKLRNEWNESDGFVLPGLKEDGRKRGNNTKLREEHSAFIIT